MATSRMRFTCAGWSIAMTPLSVPTSLSRRTLVCMLACQLLMACGSSQVYKRAGSHANATAASCDQSSADPQCLPHSQTLKQTSPSTTQHKRTLYSREGPAPRAEAGPETWIVLTIFLVSISSLTGFVLLRTLPPFCDASLGCHQAP